jgi:1,4-alpha-glucan branching enzyme
MAGWRADEVDVGNLIAARHGDPFSLLGLHETRAGMTVRAFVPHAESVAIETLEGEPVATLERRPGTDFFEALIPGRARRFLYRLQASNAGGSWSLIDPYAFGPVLGPLDDHLLVEGTHRQLYEKLGAHVMTHGGVQGVHFAVWAPEARRVSVVGDFNDWDGRRHQMRKRVDSGIWEIFAPEIGEGTIYKFEIVGPDDVVLPLKADPVGFASELRPSTASVVAKTDAFSFDDADFIETRGQGDPRRKPMSIYEVHLASWQKADGWRFMNWDEIADRLIPYAVDLGFTHLELLPITEHPLDASWGYQPIGLFSPTARHGDPAGFARFVNRAHQAGLGILLDWVPAHFPTDQHGLAHFDGRPLYEYADPRRGFHPDWNTAIYDFGRREVANFLAASALYWLDRFHVDGLRVDAVASMLYLDYSRKAGEWLPNPDGSNQNHQAVDFLQTTNKLAYGEHPGTMTIAEESTSWPGVSRPAHEGGLGFGFKWNMGWMHDTLDYMSLDPVFRRFHHDKLTFGLLYAFSENFVLPLSHDEVVHGKGSMLGKMSGDDWQQFANLRSFYGFMWAHPGKKLMFMGQEFAQRREWNFETELDWHLLGAPLHAGVRDLVRDLNRVYRGHGALHARDCEGEGFRWVVTDDKDQSVIVFLRFGGEGDPPVVVCCNFTPVVRYGYRIGLPAAGRWKEILNTDAANYGGSGIGNLGAVHAAALSSHGLPASADVILPPLSTVYFEYDGVWPPA